MRNFTRHTISAAALGWALLTLHTTPAAAQRQPTSPLYRPRAIANAYRKGTRSPDGRPGPRYWQNRARYAISLTALPPDRTVRGTEQVTYVNASPDTLRSLVLKLFINIHKPGAVRTSAASEDYLTSGTHVDTVTVNGARVAWPDNPSRGTNARLALPAPLLPHDSVRLGFAWHYDVSREAGREGMIDSTTWFLAYAYPRVAVYDDYNGWDTMDFTDMQEFYSDFNDYDVTVTVPSRYVVWGTGTLTNAAEVLQPTVLRRFQQSLRSDTTIHVATREELAAGHVATASGATNRWRFTARNVPDVAFNISDHYLWDAGSTVVDSSSGRREGVQAAYSDTAADYRHMVRFAGRALRQLSTAWPGVPYPYEKTTVVQGPAGMEYPMMANDESYADTSFAAFVAEHEIAHTYMPFYMGINESRYAFMDEGWATTFEYLMNTANWGAERATKAFQEFRVNGWIGDPSPLADLPIITPADALKGNPYGSNAYGKPALGYLALKDLLGDATFRRALQGYMARWNGKHPTPWDFFASVNDITGRNLDWFWRSWFFESSYIDIGIAGVRTSGGRTMVTLENTGGMPAPVDLVVTYADGTSATLHQTPATWERDPRRATVTLPGRKAVRDVHLRGGIWVDADSTNDRWPRTR